MATHHLQHDPAADSSATLTPFVHRNRNKPGFFDEMQFSTVKSIVCGLKARFFSVAYSLKLKPEPVGMELCPTVRKVFLTGRNYLSLSVFVFSFHNLTAQETNSRASGKVYSDSNEAVAGVTVTIIHEPTQSKYVDVTRNDGYFHFFNLRPGGPYSIICTSVGYESLKKTGLFIHLTGEYFSFQEDEITEFFLQKKIAALEEVIVESHSNRSKSGMETNISGFTLKSLPTISRNFQDLVRLVPQAKVTGDGVMSFAGQNNRFNAFFIDGANNNDILGISVNGMNGGQTGSPPISMEAIEEFNVSLAPYDVQYGNFTGGSMNTITRSGSNENKSSVWYYFRNENLAGKSPEPLPKPGSPGESHSPKLSSFFNQTFGIWNSGAIVKNKLFYFVLFEKQTETRPQPFNMSVYEGDSKEQDLIALTRFIKDTYQYEPGSFLETKDVLDAIRMNIKLDWNLSVKNKFTMAYRYNNAERTFPPRVSSNNSIFFENSGIILPATTHSISAEWKRFMNKNMNNRLLITFTNQVNNRKWMGQPFPAITITDGNGSRSSISFGSESNTGMNAIKANDLTLFNVFKYVRKKHIYTLGVDINYSTLDIKAIPNYFGLYSFTSVTNFIAGTARLRRGYFLPEGKDNPAKFHTLRTSIFVNDEIRAKSNFKLNFGLRLDVNSVPSTPITDTFFNKIPIQAISGYYDLDGAESGKTMKPDWALSPRIGVDYKIPRYEINLKGGAGIFVGHIVNRWHFDVFGSNSGSIDIPRQQFIPDPYNQPDSHLRDLNLIARDFKYPAVFRSSLVIEKKLWKNWMFSIEGIFTKNIQDAAFRNVNILPPTLQSEKPDSRNVYDTSKFPPPQVVNSYGTVYLLTNNHNKKGNSYSISFIIQKQAKNFSFSSSYTFARSSILFEITGTQTALRAQWQNMETVNGRNFTEISTSDNDLQHRITTWVSKKFNYGKNKTATTISLFYNGQSGTPYSYVYENSMINDNGRQGENFNLIYIPTASDLASMNFDPITNTITPGLGYSPQQQKDFLNSFIESDKYLKKHRGEFAKRNGVRLPFTHVVDLRLQQDFHIKIKGKNLGVAVIYDVFNLTNMLNKNWGRTYFLLNDSYPLITFTGFASTTPDIIPKYQSKPFTGKPYSLQTSTIPGNSARWISQLGIRINFN